MARLPVQPARGRGMAPRVPGPCRTDLRARRRAWHRAGHEGPRTRPPDSATDPGRLRDGDRRRAHGFEIRVRAQRCRHHAAGRTGGDRAGVLRHRRRPGHDAGLWRVRRARNVARAPGLDHHGIDSARVAARDADDFPAGVPLRDESCAGTGARL